MTRSLIRDLLKDHRTLFATGRTRELSFRREQLKRLRSALIVRESAILEALHADLGKPAFEAYAGENAIVIREIDHALRHLASWARPRRVQAPISHFPARCTVVREPLGVVLIIGPWNFPVQLTFAPLVAAIAAGNCAVLKPPPLTPRTTAVIRALCEETFERSFVSVVEGGAETVQDLLAERFDHIFFTGGTATGKLVMQAAAKHLTPITLELGGKNPCIVDHDVDLDVTARRVAWGKLFNAGQNCAAVDHVFVDRRIKDAFVTKVVAWTRRFYGADPAASPDYARIINEAHVDRLAALLHDGTIVSGGAVDRPSRFVAPTVIDNITGSEPVMQEEVFGPILPVLTFDDIADAVAAIRARPAPLALYVFSRSHAVQKRVLDAVPSGGACVNDVVLQETVPGLPFGGVGESGIGSYHGKAGFNVFSRERSVLRNGFLVDPALRYPPYGNRLRILKRLV